MTFNGRIHSNANIYALRNIKFLNRLSMAGEFVRSATRGGEPNTLSGADQVFVDIGGINVQSMMGSMQAGGGTVGGPHFMGSTTGQRGYFPGSPNGVFNPNWETESVRPTLSGTPDRFGGQVLTNTTGADLLKIPLELSGNSSAEIIKRLMPADTQILATLRYHTKSQVRILIDDETAGNGATNVAGIPAGRGVLLSQFMPSILGSGNALRTISDTGAVGGVAIRLENPDNSISPNAVTQGNTDLRDSGPTPRLTPTPPLPPPPIPSPTPSRTPTPVPTPTPIRTPPPTPTPTPGNGDG